MKILLLNNASFSRVDGALRCETNTGKFAAELKESGFDVTMYGQIVDKPNAVHAFDIGAQEIATVGVERRSFKIFNYLMLYLLAIPEIVKSDFVYIFYPSSFKYIAVLCWVLKTPYGLYVRGQQGIDTKSSIWIYRKALSVIAVTGYFTRMIEGISGIKTAYTIRPMISLTEEDIVRGRIYTKKKHFTLLFLARVEEDKGVRELLYAMKELKVRGRSVTLNLVGDGGYLSQAMNLIDQLDITDVVCVKGAVHGSDRIKRLYLEADIYVLPTYHEGFPRTLYEAMIFGVPVITTFVGGIPGIMVDGFNCIRIEPRSVSSIVEAVEQTVDDYQRCDTLANNGYKTVAEIVDSSRLTHAQQLIRILIGDP